MIFGTLQAIPHMAHALEMGADLCLNGSKLDAARIVLLQGHCWGCAVALIGATLVFLPLIRARRNKTEAGHTVLRVRPRNLTAFS